ncbi:unnamed protein product, partial [Mesorhabditis spiculigera]
MGKKFINKKHANRSKSNGNRRDGFTPVEKTNEKYWAFYKAQALFPEEEWDDFQAVVRRDLPSAFRVQGCHKDRQTLIAEMEKRFFTKIRAAGDASVFVPEELPWYPGAYQTRMSRTEVRSHPILAQLHNFLVTEAELGSISRQEAVSMIPPLLLNPAKDHFVLDLCAAPGSKTMQLIEMMHEEDPNPTGMVIANDVDKKRCYMLVRQTLKRMKNANTAVINEDATQLPDFKWKDGSTRKFDRVLCDVICSGDGTVRKNPDIWEKWSPQEGIGIHKLQLSIARRAVEQLAVGGRMVYSTCSMNPMEDEAVVAQLLREAKGGLRLIDAHPMLPKLKALRGVNKWKVISKAMVEYPTHADVPEELQRPIVKSLFPPTEEEAATMNLPYTMRIVPHHQDTGGFFVALLEKVSEVEFTRENSNVKGAVWRKKFFKDDPFTFLKEDDERWFDIRNHYGISDTFHYQNLFNRMLEDQNSRQLFYVNDAVKEFLKANMAHISIINAGMRMFGRNENKVEQVKFRVSQEGIGALFPYLSKQVLQISRKDMLTILRHEGNLVPMEELEAGEAMRKNLSGSLVVYVDRDDPVCTWIGQKTCAPYVGKEEKVHLLRLLGEDTEVIEDLMRNNRRAKAVADRNAVDEERARAKNGENDDAETAEEAPAEVQDDDEGSGGYRTDDEGKKGEASSDEPDAKRA